MPFLWVLRAFAILVAFAPSAWAAPADNERLSTNIQPIYDAFERGFGRMSPHQPLYFIYGKSPEAKYQLSFNYRLFSAPGVGGLRAVSFGYTQRGLWDIGAPSSPFYDTSYMPEVFWSDWAPKDFISGGGAHWLGYQAGVMHESNGKEGGDSRSLDIAYVRPIAMFGDMKGWNFIVGPRIFAYFPSTQDNPDIADYRGYGEWLAVFGKNTGISISVLGRTGRHFKYGSFELNATYPINIPAIDFSAFFLTQWFEGYGESLRGYNRRSSSIRAGLAFVR